MITGITVTTFDCLSILFSIAAFATLVKTLFPEGFTAIKTFPY